MLPELELLRVFVKVVDEGSINAAARKLEVCVGNVSRKIRHLENRVNERLLRRTKKGVQLTKRGEEIYNYALETIFGWKKIMNESNKVVYQDEA